MYIETTNKTDNPRYAGDKAVLMSPWYDFEGKNYTVTVLRFYSHMIGEDIGELNVYTEGEDGSKTRRLHLTEREF